MSGHKQKSFDMSLQPRICEWSRSERDMPQTDVKFLISFNQNLAINHMQCVFVCHLLSAAPGRFYENSVPSRIVVATMSINRKKIKYRKVITAIVYVCV